jgi:hypothetical protein
LGSGLAIAEEGERGAPNFPRNGFEIVQRDQVRTQTQQTAPPRYAVEFLGDVRVGSIASLCLFIQARGVLKKELLSASQEAGQCTK